MATKWSLQGVKEMLSMQKQIETAKAWAHLYLKGDFDDPETVEKMNNIQAENGYLREMLSKMDPSESVRYFLSRELTKEEKAEDYVWSNVSCASGQIPTDFLFYQNRFNREGNI